MPDPNTGALNVIDIAFNGQWNANTLLVTICGSLAFYNSIELLILIFTTFNVYKGLYFWSLLIATAGILPYLIGVFIVYFSNSLSVVGWILSCSGWVFMVSGQSVVLYSRLGIVLGKGHDKILSFVKWMIIVDGVTLHTMTHVVTFGSHFAAADAQYGFRHAYYYIEKIQMTGFCLQELIISGIYIWKALDLIRTGQRKHHHRIMAQLFAINLIMFLLDIGLLALEYKNLFIAEISFKSLCYSVKLKLEFAILSKLVEYSESGRRRCSNFFGDTRASLDTGSIRNESFATMTRAETLPSSKPDGRPQWMYDVEKIDTIPVSSSKQVATDASEVSAAMSDLSDHNFDSISRPDRCRKKESDLMYAEAMRIISQ